MTYITFHGELKVCEKLDLLLHKTYILINSVESHDGAHIARNTQVISRRGGLSMAMSRDLTLLATFEGATPYMQ